jgi:hypothetical protein
MAEMKTKAVRIREDLAEKASEISDATNETISDILDPIIREEIDAVHARLLPAIRAIKNARRKHQAEA